MSHYKDKLAALTEKTKKLLDEKNKLIEKRKNEIGLLAEKYELLEISNDVMRGLFLEVQQALKDKSDKLKNWESLGARFRKPASEQQPNI